MAVILGFQDYGMSFTKKITILAVVFALTAGLVAVTFSSEDGKGGEVSYEIEKLAIQGWQEKSVATSRAVLDTLQATRTFFADYSKDGSESVNLYIGYYDSLDKSKLSHAPQVCFTAQGWIMKKNDKITVRLNGIEHTINRLLLEKDKEQLLVYYWYQTATAIYADLFRMKLALLGTKIKQGKNAQGGNAFIRISTPVSKGQKSATLVLQEFFKDLSKELSSFFSKQL